MSKLKDKNILICITGSIAAYKSCEIIRNLRKEGAQIQVAISKSGQKFIGSATLAALSNNKVITDLFPENPEGGLEHIDLAFDIDLIVIAPATANILCKVGNGVADDLISTTLSVCEQKQIFAPAMNYRMWQNQATIDAVKKLKSRNKIVLNPEEGELASLHTGEGRLPSIKNIMNEIRKAFDTELYLEDKNVLVTAGPTRESIDPVRFISNRSSGKMGYAIATAARNRGAEVSLLSTKNVSLQVPLGVENNLVETSSDLEKMILLKSDHADVIIMAAAVCDFKPLTKEDQKIKKTSYDKKLNLELEQTPDILKQIKNKKIKKIAFAAETENLIENAKIKLKEKNLDMIIANDVSREDIGFNSDDNQVTIIQKNGSVTELPVMPKTDLAHILLDETITLINI